MTIDIKLAQKLILAELFCNINGNVGALKLGINQESIIREKYLDHLVNVRN
jgi:hypothetical protein